MIRNILLASMVAITGPALAQVPRAPAAMLGIETWELDQLRIARDVSQEKLKPIEADHSLDAVIHRLNRLGIAFKRVHVRLAADKLPGEVKNQILSLPPGEPFVIPEDEFWSISVILGRTLPPGSVRFIPDHPRRFALSKKSEL